MNKWRFKMLYDGECPLCQREAAFLRRRDRHGWLAFEDITAPGFDPAVYGLTREALMGVIHGVYPDGRVVRKLAVFREAYRAIGRALGRRCENGVCAAPAPKPPQP